MASLKQDALEIGTAKFRYDGKDLFDSSQCAAESGWFQPPGTKGRPFVLDEELSEAIAIITLCGCKKRFEVDGVKFLEPDLLEVVRQSVLRLRGCESAKYDDARLRCEIESGPGRRSPAPVKGWKRPAHRKPMGNRRRDRLAMQPPSNRRELHHGR